MSTVYCPRAAVDQTLKILQAAGRRRRESVVLWLSKRDGERIDTQEIYVPVQTARRDFFRIPPDGMKALMKYLRWHRLMVGAQVHSHPGTAFHSKADDEWAIVRHSGAVSIVVPDFAAHTTGDSFFEYASVYTLSPTNRWLKVLRSELGSKCVIA